MRSIETAEGTMYAAEDETVRGEKAPFYAVYRTPDRERRYGWLCGNCDSLDNAMDPMGRIKCNVCGNLRKPETWDAAHE